MSLLPLWIPIRCLVCSTLYKDKNSDIFGVSYASCGPTISGGGWQGSGQGVSVPPLHIGLVSQLPRCPLLLAKQQQEALQEKRTINNDLQYIQ